MKRFLSVGVVAAVFGLTGCKEGTSVAPATTATGSTAPAGPGTTTVTDATGTSKPADPNARGEMRKLDVTSPGSQTVTQDLTDELKVAIDRKNFDGPVTVELRQLPTGVTVVTKDLTIPADKDSVTVTVKAAPDAPPVASHKSIAAAKAPGMPDATVDFEFTVKAK